MNKVREIQRLNKIELERGVPPSASWHTDYRHTAYIFFGGLPYDLTEGDVITIFSQFGEPTFVKLARDKETGKSRGFGWLKYEDQRSCDLAVDNLAGATILNRAISVDHAEYKKRDDDDEDGADIGPKAKAGFEQKELPRHNRHDTSESELDRPKRKMLPEEMELLKLIAEHDDEDPMKDYLVDEKKKEVEEALARQRETEERHDKAERKHHRRRRDSDTRKRREREDVDDSRHRRRKAADDREDRRRSRSSGRSDKDERRYRHSDSYRSASPGYDRRSRRDRRHRSRSSSDDASYRRNTRRERSSDRRDRRDRHERRDDSNDRRRRRA